MTQDTNTASGAAARFTKNPVTIEAVQYTEAVRDAYLFDKVPLPHGVVIPATTTHPPSRKVYSAQAYIDTLEGRMKVSIGDWIIKGVKGEMYPCKDEIFRLTYSRAELASAEAPAEPAEAEMVCAEAYQVVGLLLIDLGIFDTKPAMKILDNLSQAKLAHKDVLPWSATPQPQPDTAYASLPGRPGYSHESGRDTVYGYTADQMRAFADATHALRIESRATEKAEHDARHRLAMVMAGGGA